VSKEKKYIMIMLLSIPTIFLGMYLDLIKKVESAPLYFGLGALCMTFIWFSYAKLEISKVKGEQ
jgi:hypothetical protein